MFFSFILLGCTQSNLKMKGAEFILKSKLKHTAAHFYKDFDIFNRKGIDEIEGDTLRYPFFEYFKTSDTTLQLNLHRNDEYGLRVDEMVVPTGEQIIYTFHDISDGPRHYYAKISGDTIIRYNYTELNPTEIPGISKDSVRYHEIIPSDIEYIHHDTCYLFWPECHFHKDIKDTGENHEEKGINTAIAQKDILKYAIMPFEPNLNLKCKWSRVYYFDEKGELWHYNKDDDPHEYGGKNNPVKGLYGYKKRFKYWNDFYDLGRLN